jgi:hypothetical protein
MWLTWPWPGSPPTAPRASCVGPLKPERPYPDPIQKNRTIPSHPGRPPASRVSPSVLAFIAFAYVYALRRIGLCVLLSPSPARPRPLPVATTGRAAWTRLLCGPSSTSTCCCAIQAKLFCWLATVPLGLFLCPRQPGGVTVTHSQRGACPLHRTKPKKKCINGTRGG